MYETTISINDTHGGKNEMVGKRMGKDQSNNLGRDISFWVLNIAPYKLPSSPLKLPIHHILVGSWLELGPGSVFPKHIIYCFISSRLFHLPAANAQIDQLVEGHSLLKTESIQSSMEAFRGLESVTSFITSQPQGLLNDGSNRIPHAIDPMLRYLGVVSIPGHQNPRIAVRQKDYAPEMSISVMLDPKTKPRFS